MAGNDLTWVLTTGEAGMRSQAVGLAEAVGLPIEEKRVALRRPWTWLPGGLLPMPLFALRAEGDRLAPPWPTLVVGCGRRSIDAALTIKRLSGGRTLAAYVQNPEYGLRKFDVVAALPHDGVTGSNVVTIATALHGVTAEKLTAAAGLWRARLAPQGTPLLGVLVGGDNGSYRLTDEIAEQLIRILRGAYNRYGLRAAVTPSRRTPERTKRLIAEALSSGAWGWLWDEEGNNPYLGILALADRLIVTGESISMVSEALAAGRPVHVLPLAGQGRRHDAFLTRILAQGLASVIEGDDLDWSFSGQSPIISTAEPAARIRALLGLEVRPKR
jgi:mitochondrial fission protein ELM1